MKFLESAAKPQALAAAGMALISLLTVCVDSTMAKGGFGHCSISLHTGGGGGFHSFGHSYGYGGHRRSYGYGGYGGYSGDNYDFADPAVWGNGPQWGNPYSRYSSSTDPASGNPSGDGSFGNNPDGSSPYTSGPYSSSPYSTPYAQRLNRNMPRNVYPSQVSGISRAYFPSVNVPTAAAPQLEVKNYSWPSTPAQSNDSLGVRAQMLELHAHQAVLSNSDRLSN